ncbi:MAG: helix-turn-helix transcriptional regulator [Lachnospiraceae bacterium]|nr:helix-turn-helix transcriptional regulator [Lachnospiraceae bacterium]
MFDRYESERFGTYIARLRRKRNVSMEQLSEGLCSLSMLGRFEKGERLPEKQLRDRLLTRLGETPIVYENYLDTDEYTQWKLRQQILESIVDWKRDKTDTLLTAYRKQCDMENPLEKQFVLTMEAQWKRREGTTAAELAVMFEEAVKQTVPGVDKKSIIGMCLSMQEIDLILEYEHYRISASKQAKYEEIMQYILESDFDAVSRAKTYPKTVYYLCLELEKENNREADRRILNLCNDAIEVLRDACYMCYLWELLRIRLRVIKRLGKRTMAEAKRQTELEAEQLLELQKESEKLLKALENLHKEFDVRVAMSDSCYLYVEKEVYCIGDVIRIRRKMLGLSRAQLCEGICSLKTIGRIERNQLKTQRQIVRELFERLHMSREYQRMELVTENPVVQELFAELRWRINEREHDKVQAILEELKGMVEMELPSNKQALERMMAAYELQSGKLSKEAYMQRMREVLEYTLPYKVATAHGEKYMTNEEITCIQNMVIIMDWENPELEKCIAALEEVYRQPEEEDCVGVHICMYATIMSVVDSQLGNKGEYERSDTISKIIIRECLKSHVITYIANGLYNLLWNYEQKEKEHIPVWEKRNVLRDLGYCVLFSRFTRQKFWEANYKDKLNKRINFLNRNNGE